MSAYYGPERYPRPAHKIRRERSWRTYSDFQHPIEPPPGPGADERYQDTGRRDNGYERYDLSREYVFEEYERQSDWEEAEYRGEYEPMHEHDDRYDQEYDHSYEHWQRRRYGGAVSVPGEYRERGRDRYDTAERVGARPSYRMPPPNWSDERYMADEYYAYAPEYYRERYMPEEDYLKKLYMLMFRNIEYDIKVPIMQIIATGALFFIFMLNYSINYQYVEHLGNFSPWVALQPPPVAAILGAIFGIFIYLFPSLDRDLKRTIVIGTIVLLIFFFAGPALWVGFSTYELQAVGKAFASSLFEFLKLAAVLVYWAPIFLGIYGIWSRNSFYIGISAMFLFLTIIVLDIYLAIQGIPILKVKGDWVIFVIFSIILFCYIEMSISAITFANLTSTEHQKEIDPSYYEHLDRILKKDFVYFIVLTIFIIILTWLTLHFSDFLRAIESDQLAESLELTSVYGVMISLVVMGIIILFIGLFIRNEDSFRSVGRRILKAISGSGSPREQYYTPIRKPQQAPARQYMERERM